MTERTLNKEEFYGALGLFLVASRKQKESDALQDELSEILRGGKSTEKYGGNVADWVSDFVFDDDQATIEVFLDLLDRLNIELDGIENIV